MVINVEYRPHYYFLGLQHNLFPPLEGWREAMGGPHSSSCAGRNPSHAIARSSDASTAVPGENESNGYPNNRFQ